MSDSIINPDAPMRQRKRAIRANITVGEAIAYAAPRIPAALAVIAAVYAAVQASTTYSVFNAQTISITFGVVFFTALFAVGLGDAFNSDVARPISEDICSWVKAVNNLDMTRVKALVSARNELADFHDQRPEFVRLAGSADPVSGHEAVLTFDRLLWAAVVALGSATNVARDNELSRERRNNGVDAYVEQAEVNLAAVYTMVASAEKAALHLEACASLGLTDLISDAHAASARFDTRLDAFAALAALDVNEILEEVRKATPDAEETTDPTMRTAPF